MSLKTFVVSACTAMSACGILCLITSKRGCPQKAVDGFNIKLANWNGEYMPIEDVKVSVLDRAFLFGDSCYEVLRVYDGFCWNLDEHMERLAQSLSEININAVDISQLTKTVQETVRRSTVKSGLVYIQVTRGTAARRHSFPAGCTPNQLVWVQEFPDPYAGMRESGVSVITYPDIRWRRNDIKCTSLMANCLAATAADAHECAEALFINHDGFVTEGSHTSMFGVKNGQIIIAPRSREVLPGITKRMVIELSERIKAPLHEHRLRKEDLHGLDEMFMTGTPEEIVPIIKVDDFFIGTGKPGPIVRALQNAFKERVAEWLAAVRV